MFNGDSRVVLRGLSSHEVSHIFVDLEMREGAEIRASFLMTARHDLRIIRSISEGAGGQVVRGTSHIREASKPDSYFICAPRKGSIAIAQAGRRSAVPAGDFTILDTRLEYTIDLASKLDALWISLPINSFEAVVQRPLEIVGRRLSGASGMGYVASRFIASLKGPWQDSPRQGEIPLGSITAELIRGAASDSPQTPSHSDPDHWSTTERARAFIDLHLGDEGLDPERVAKGVGVSRRHLSELFAAEGTTIMGWARLRRLELCADELERSLPRSGLIAEIAYKYGFANISSFNRVFAQTFGKTPTQHVGRAPGLLRPPSPHSNDKLHR